MRKLTATLCLTIAVLLGSEVRGFDLPPCRGSYHNCFGTQTFPNGDKYVGEFSNGKRHGQGTYTFANGRVQEGIWKNNKFQYAQKVSPTGTAIKAPTTSNRTSTPKVYPPTITIRRVLPPPIRRVPPPSKSAPEKENERLRKEIARLKKQKQSQTKQVAERTEPKPNLSLAKRTQEALQVLEIYSGKIDGIIGVKTRLAIRGWQSRNGYPVTGAIDQTQIAKLEESAIRYLKEKKSKPKQIAKKPSPKKAPEPISGSTGSGFFVSKLGHIITNEHVVRKCGSVTVGDNANKQVVASVLDTDKRNDLALLRISSTQMASVDTKSLISKLGLKLVPLASEGLFKSDDVELGETVLWQVFPMENFSVTPSR